MPAQPDHCEESHARAWSRPSRYATPRHSRSNHRRGCLGEGSPGHPCRGLRQSRGNHRGRGRGPPTRSRGLSSTSAGSGGSGCPSCSEWWADQSCRIAGSDDVCRRGFPALPTWTDDLARRGVDEPSFVGTRSRSAYRQILYAYYSHSAESTTRKLPWTGWEPNTAERGIPRFAHCVDSADRREPVPYCFL